MTFLQGHWQNNVSAFALDVQTWAIDALGPQKLDSWFGTGAAYALWQKTKAFSACYDAHGQLAGVGFTNEHDRISVEWTAGAILATRLLARYYHSDNLAWADGAQRDSRSMRKGIESLRHRIQKGIEAYSYSSRRDWIPFGWNSHDAQVLSLAATGWVILIDRDLNPFYFFSPGV